MKRGGRLRDLALVIPIGGVILFLPPYVQIFDQPWTIGGVPFLHISLFAIWTLGIVITAMLSSRLSRLTSLPEPSDGSGEIMEDTVTGDGVSRDRDAG